ncbi:MAG: thiol:disulfide interchange protein [Flavobacteriaceae bacterium]|nr:thiol:disulfide interchange protein [Flavobacteriaceae bacterium]
MKKVFSLFALTVSLLLSTAGFSQIFEPVKWNTEIEDLGDGTFNLIMKATIDDGWYLYSQNVPDGGPIPTAFTFTNEDGAFEVLGETLESEGKTKFDKVFEMELTTFTNEATFTQKIKRLDGGVTNIAGIVDFQSCDDEKCIFEMADLSFDLPKGKESVADKKDTEQAADLDDDEDESDRGLWAIFFLAFFSGFAALLTPCVFPMIPLTVSFFTKQSKTRAVGVKNAILYGVFIIVIYVLLGSMVTAIFGSDVLNELSTSVWFNVVFFILLVVFAISFLGAFEITLPQSWANKVDNKANKGGIVGIFFMALALAIVSFSCTGPIVGGLLVEAASKGGLAPIIGMLGFSLAIALPFTLFAIFPGWLNSLPKSGGWLNTVKVVLGFLELAFAFKFLSQADLVLQLHLLEREVFIAIWIAVFGALALYLLGKIRLPHDGPLTHISVGRLLLGLLTLSFVIYMVPGLWGAPLKLISAFPPPLDYSESPYGVGYTKLGGGSAALGAEVLPDGGHLMAPHDILHFYDYEKGLKYAKEVNKPVMIDFTGWACVNCRKMEQNVWPEPGVLRILKNEVVLISLYVDEKRDLPEEEQYVSPETGKKIKTIGNKWSDFQIKRYQTNAQPYYVLMDHNEKNLVKPEDYNPDAEAYEAWLKRGVEAFKNQ